MVAAKKITAVGTIMANRRVIPTMMSSLTGRVEHSYKVMWENEEGKLSLHSYVVNTKSKGKNNVLVLATVPPLLGTTLDDGKHKPALLKLYDFTKGSTDVMDQRMSSYSTNTKAKRWTLAAFSYLLDTARVNSQTLWSLNNAHNPIKTNSFNFAYDLAIHSSHSID